MARKVVSLYMCGHARLKGEEIYCKMGYKLCKTNLPNYNKLENGKPFIYRVCQNCPDYFEIGKNVKPEDRGWK